MARGKPLTVRGFVRVNGEYVSYDSLTSEQKDEFATRIAERFAASFGGRVKIVEDAV